MKTFVKVWLGISIMAIGIGIAIIVIATASGARWEDISAFSEMHGSYEGVERIDFEFGYGDIKIKNGDAFSISAEHIVEDQINSYVSDGTWYIRESEEQYFSVFGWKFPVNGIRFWKDDFGPDITITVPEGFQAEKIDLSILAGSVKADEINSLEGNFHIEAGELEIEKLNIKEESQYSVGAGDLYLLNAALNDVTMDCGMGDIEFEGVITGDNHIKCGMGKMKFILNAAEEDYSYEISSGIGDVNINRHSYNSISSKVIKNENAEHNLNLDCGMGDITVEFEQ